MVRLIKMVERIEFNAKAQRKCNIRNEDEDEQEDEKENRIMTTQQREQARLSLLSSPRSER